MRRGTRVGEAYVALAIDGSNVNKDIEDSFDGVDYKRLGHAHGEEAGAEFSKGFEAKLDEIRKKIDKTLNYNPTTGRRNSNVNSITQAFANDDAIVQGALGQTKSLLDDGRLDVLMKQVGARLGRDFGGDFSTEAQIAVTNGIHDIIEDALRNGDLSRVQSLTGSRGNGPRLLGKDLERIQAEAEKLVSDGIARREKLEADFTKFLAGEDTKRISAAKKTAERIADDFKYAVSQSAADDLLVKFRIDPAKFSELREKIRANLEQAGELEIKLKDNGLTLREREKIKAQLAGIEAKIKVDLDERSMAAARAKLEKGLGSKISSFGGAAFGAGFFNLFFKGLGASITGIENLGSHLTSLSNGGGIGFQKLIKGAFGFAGAFSGITLVVSLLATALSGLGGVITALAATITSGLVGALIVGSATLSAFAATAALVATTFGSMNEEQKKVLKFNFRPVVNEFHDLGQIMLQSVLPATKQWGQNLGEALSKAEPLARRMGPVLAQIGTSFTKSLSGPGWKLFLDSLTKNLPAIATNMGHALGQFLNGFGALFARLMPYVVDFSKHLNDVANRFAKWSESAKGQNAIADFTDRALVSLHALWSFTKQVGGLLKDVLLGPAGQNAGNGIFDGLTHSLAAFRERIANGELEAWFKRAGEFAHGFGELLAGLGNVFHAMVSDGSMTLLVSILKAVAGLMQILAPIVGALVSALGPLLNAVSSLAAFLGTLPGPLQVLSAGLVLVAANAVKTALALKTLSLSSIAGGMGGFAKNVAVAGLAVAGTSLAMKKGASDASILSGAALNAGAAFLALPPGLNIAGAAIVGLGTAIFGFWKKNSEAEKAAQQAHEQLIQSLTASAAAPIAAFASSEAAAHGYADVLGHLRDETFRSQAVAAQLKTTLDASVPAYANGLNSMENFTGGVKSSVEANKGLVAQLDKANAAYYANIQVYDAAKKALIDQATSLGFNTTEWGNYTDTQLRASASTVFAAAKLREQGYELGLNGVKLSTIKNTLLDYAAASDFSAAQTSALVGQIDSMSPSAIDRVNASLQGTVIIAGQGINAIGGLVGAIASAASAAGSIAYAVGAGKKAMTPQEAYQMIFANLPKGGGGYTPNYGAPYGGSGGSGGSKSPAQYKNPYVAYANSLIKDGPSVSAQVKNALLIVGKQVADTIRSASLAKSGSDFSSAINGLISDISTKAQETVNSAQQGLNSAAQSLASASSAGAAANALKKVHDAQATLAQALKNKKNIDAAVKNILGAQKGVNSKTTTWVQQLIGQITGNDPGQITHIMDVLRVQNATLAQYAIARSQVSTSLEVANQKLADAISTRDSYNSQVIEAAKSFGFILTAQAKTINGVTLALTADDITSNLSDRLAKIKAFQANLQILLSRGLSKDAYKQLVDAGVEQGSAYAQALVAGGQGATTQVNSLTQQISDVASQLGGQASNQLYQAGVNAAQGLVDGLTSLSAQLDSAATKLGNSIAEAVKKALGIKSPSRVMIAQMGYVGDGIVAGLDAQHDKVGVAASRLSSRVAVSPEIAAYAASQRKGDPVSGNSTTHEWHITTPTEDPQSVAREMINEMTGRL